jgi:hypothetical protein
MKTGVQCNVYRFLCIWAFLSDLFVKVFLFFGHACRHVRRPYRDADTMKINGCNSDKLLSVRCHSDTGINTMGRQVITLPESLRLLQPSLIDFFSPVASFAQTKTHMDAIMQQMKWIVYWLLENAWNLADRLVAGNMCVCKVLRVRIYVGIWIHTHGYWDTYHMMMGRDIHAWMPCPWAGQKQRWLVRFYTVEYNLHVYVRTKGRILPGYCLPVDHLVHLRRQGSCCPRERKRDARNLRKGAHSSRLGFSLYAGFPWRILLRILEEILSWLWGRLMYLLFQRPLGQIVLHYFDLMQPWLPLGHILELGPHVPNDCQCTPLIACLELNSTVENGLLTRFWCGYFDFSAGGLPHRLEKIQPTAITFLSHGLSS